MSNIVSVEIEDLGNFEQWVENYPRKVYVVAEKSGAKAGRETRKILLTTSPVRKQNGGKYAKGWSVRNKSTLAGGVEYVIHNKAKPHLVHLLENGHEMFIFGKYTGKRVPAKPHFEAAKRKAGDLFEQYLDKGLRELD